MFVQTDSCTGFLNQNIRNLLEILQSLEQGSCFSGFSLCMVRIGLLVPQQLLSFTPSISLDENGYSVLELLMSSICQFNTNCILSPQGEHILCFL